MARSKRLSVFSLLALLAAASFLVQTGANKPREKYYLVFPLDFASQNSLFVRPGLRILLVRRRLLRLGQPPLRRVRTGIGGGAVQADLQGDDQEENGGVAATLYISLIS